MTDKFESSSAGSSIVGVIGIGAMGRGIVKNLAEAGFEVYAYDKDSASIEALEDYGVKPASGVTDICNVASRIITCLPSIEAVRRVYLGTSGLLQNACAGTILIDCTSSDSELTKRIGTKAKDRGVSVLDAPILLGGDAIWEGRSTLILGGDPKTIEICMPVLNSFSARTIYAGELGSAHSIKAINNAVTLSNHAILSEAMSVAMASDHDLDVLFEVMGSSLADSAKLRDMALNMRAETPRKSLSFANSKKDLSNFLNLAGRSGSKCDIAQAAFTYFELGSMESGVTQAISELPSLLTKIALAEIPHDREK